VDDTPKAVRWTVYICVPLGLLLLAAGIYGDSRQWWEGHSYVTNLVSSFTSLLFGVPTALIALSHLSMAQAEAANRKAVQKRARMAVQGFRAAVMGGLDACDDNEAMSKISDALGGNRELSRLVPADVNPDQQLTPEESRSLRETASERQRLMEQVLLHGRTDFTGWIADIVHRWTSLDRDVRPRLEEVGLSWMSPFGYREVRLAIRALEEHNTGLVFIDLSSDTVWRGQVRTWGTVLERFDDEIDNTRQLFRALRRLVLWLKEIDDAGSY
jgi:hypothetical protein